MEKTIVMSLGGSLIVPSEIDTAFLKDFRSFAVRFVKDGHRLVIFSGGGMTARNYQQAASKLGRIANDELDRIGIFATQLNAHLLRCILKEYAHEVIIQNPHVLPKSDKPIIIGAGWKPGSSTDYDAVLVAHNIGVSRMINMSNITYVYDKDPRVHADAKPFEKLMWKEYRALISKKWTAGMNAPFDPVAAREAQDKKITVAILGKDLANVKAYLEGKKFKGTVIG